jgi:hypothetical protein
LIKTTVFSEAKAIYTANICDNYSELIPILELDQDRIITYKDVNNNESSGSSIEYISLNAMQRYYFCPTIPNAPAWCKRSAFVAQP